MLSRPVGKDEPSTATKKVMLSVDGGRGGTGAEVDENERDAQHSFSDEEILEVHSDLRW